MLGQDAAGIAGERTRAEIGRLMRGELRERSPGQLITGVCGSRAATRYEKNERLLVAFSVGFGILETTA